jgi:hypothetical protein
VQVPADEQLEREIRQALTQHVERALNSAFPQDGEAASRSARTCALIALSQLADAEGRRGEGLRVPARPGPTDRVSGRPRGTLLGPPPATFVTVPSGAILRMQSADRHTSCHPVARGRLF